MGALLGPFWLNKPLAAGGMGEVWSGVHRDQGVQVAIKFLTRDASDPDFRAAFDAEVAAMAALDHPNVVRIYDYGDVGDQASANLVARVGRGTPYIVMEQARGTLADREEPLPWRTVHTALQHLLAALAHAHAHDMLHRDLKPGNVLLCPGEREEEPDRIVLTDFGFASRVGDRESKVVGLTPSYAAPEQLRWDARAEGPWTDLFALGCLAWRLLTGLPPYQATSVDEALAKQARGIPRLDGVDVPPGVHDWLRRALSPFPQGRFPSAADAASALADAIAGQPMTLTSLPHRWSDPGAGRRTTHLAGTGLGLFGVRRVRLVGRERERGHLWAALREARAGQARVVMLRGSSGVGTSRLARWLVTRAHEDAGLTTLWASHSQRPSSHDGVDGMLRRALRCDDLGPVQLEERISRWLEEQGAASGGARSLAIALTGGGNRIGRMASFRDVLVRLGRGRPVVVVLDDAQYGAEAVDLALTMVRHPQNAPVLLVLTFGEEALRERPDLLAKVRDIGSRPEVRDLTLSPLRPAERQQLLTQQLGLEDAVSGRVAEVSEGNPAVALALLSDWVEQQLLVPDPDGGWRLKDDDHIELPARMVEPWLERVDRALHGRPDDDGRAMEIAAVLGMRVSTPQWDSACRQAGHAPLPDLVTVMTRRGLVRDDSRRGDPGWAFADGRARAALQKRAEQAGRAAAWHGLVADALGRHDPRRARHLLAAGRREEALVPLYQGLMGQLADDPPATSAARLRRLRATVDQLSLPPDDPRTAWPQHGGAALALARGDLHSAERDAMALEEMARARGWNKQVSRALTIRAEVARRVLALEQASSFASNALSAASTRADHLRGLQQLAASERLRGRLKAASRLLKEGRAMAVDRGDAHSEGWMWVEVARIGMAVARFKDANRALGSARTAFAKAGSRSGYCLVGEHVGLLALFEGDLRVARQRLSSARQAWLQAGQRRPAIRCANRLALVAIANGEMEPATRAVRDSLAVADSVGDRPLELVARLALAYLLSLQGKRVEAERLVAEVAGATADAGWVDPELAFVASMGAPDLPSLRPLAHGQLMRLGRRNEAAHFADS